MTEDQRTRANVLKNEITSLRLDLAAIEHRGLVSILANSRYFTNQMPTATNKVIRTIVEAELMDQLETLEEEMEAL